MCFHNVKNSLKTTILQLLEQARAKIGFRCSCFDVFDFLSYLFLVADLAINYYKKHLSATNQKRNQNKNNSFKASRHKI